MTYEVVKKVDIPVMVKLSQNVTNMSKVAAAVEKAGGAGISAIDTVRCILNVDVDKRTPSLSAYGGYSGAPIRPLGLASVAAIAQSTHLPICGIGGIETGENILEYIMLGATAVQVGTAVMLNGFSYIDKLKSELTQWMEENNIDNLDDIRGTALANIKSFDEFQVEPKVARLNSPCNRQDCSICVNACIYDAITKNGNEVSVDTSLCRGCGLCVDICPDNLFELTWS
jgi:Pyruvate/2-oxoacid:ferredoxin oxidoreductase delta subunit